MVFEPLAVEASGFDLGAFFLLVDYLQVLGHKEDLGLSNDCSIGLICVPVDGTHVCH